MTSIIIKTLELSAWKWRNQERRRLIKVKSDRVDENQKYIRKVFETNI